MNYIEIKCLVQPRNPWVEILLANLSVFPFESFEENDEGLCAYIKEQDFTEDIINDIELFKDENPLDSFNFSKTLIPSKNWNAVWENSFDPILVDDWCFIRAPFHRAKANVEVDIEIEPKMSFGTGHHQTTYMMVQFIKSLNIEDRVVLDMGAGTGVLAILSKKLKAKDVDAVEIEEEGYQSCIENATRNEVEINCFCGGKEVIPSKKYDIVFANINKNVLLDQMHDYFNVLNKGGDLLLAGFLNTDVEEILASVVKEGFKLEKELKKDNWVCLKLLKV